MYGKNKNRVNYIINLVLENKKEKILIIDLEEDIEKLYPLTTLYTVSKIILNSTEENLLFYLEPIDLISYDKIIINGYQNKEKVFKEYLDLFEERIEKLKEKIIFLSKEKTNKNSKKIKKQKEIKHHKLLKKIFEINKEIDLNKENVQGIKRSRNIMIENRVI